MKQLHLFILKSYLGPFILTFFISLFVLLLQFLWKYIDDIVGKGLEWHIIAELLLYTSATLVPMALPLAILLSSIMTFGSLGENYELVALKAAGISLQKIMFPLVILSIMISVLAFFFTNNVMPRANLKFNALLYDIQNKKPQLSIKEGIFNQDIEGFSIKIGRKDNVKNVMYDMMIYDHRNNSGNKTVTIAQSGTMNMSKDRHYLVMTLQNGCTYEEQNDKEKQKYEKTLPHQRQKFEEQRVLLDLSGLKFTRSNENLFNNNFQMFTIKQLNRAMDSLKKYFDERRAAFVDGFIKSTILKKVQDSPDMESAEMPARNPTDSNAISPIKIKKITSASKDTFSKVTPININVDSLYKSLKVSQRQQIADYAANLARSVKTYVNAASNDFDFKTKNLLRHEIEWHRKFTLSFACLVLFFIGAPLGAIIRKGGLGMPMVISVVFFIIYYVISITGEKFVREEVISPLAGMWLSSFILLPLGVFLTYKAANESVLMNPALYISSMKQFFSKKPKKQNENTTTNK